MRQELGGGALGQVQGKKPRAGDIREAVVRGLTVGGAFLTPEIG